MAYNRLLQHFTSSQDLTKIWASSQNYIVNDLVVYTPSNKIYRCLIAHTSSGSFFTDLAAGNWVEVSASAAGLKNYITYGDFENNDANTGWSLARSTLDATTKLPNQAAGSWTAAAGTLSKSIVSSGQLAGSYSLSLASSAATTAGDMLVTSALTLDLEAQSSVQTFSFFYRVVSGASNGNFSGTSSNSVGVAIYVVDGTLAGTWIQPAGVWTVNTASSVTAITAKATGTFQVPSDATQVRLAVYFPNATTGAITFYLDDFVLGPQTVQYGAPVTDWVDFTPTFLNATTLNATGKTDPQGRYRRVGDSIEVQVTFQNGSGGAAAGTGDVALRIPAGLTVDTTKLTAVVGGYRADGFGTFSTSTAPGQGVIVLNNHLYLLKESSNDYYKIADLSASARWSVKATVPIQGWSSTVQMSNDTDTRVVAASAFNASGAAVTSGAAIPYTNTAYDTHGALTIGTGRFTAPVSGYYEIKFAGWIRAAGTGNSVIVYKNGSIYQAVFSFTTAGFNFSGAATLYLNAGEYADIRTDGSYNLSAGFTVFFNRLSGPSAIAATESVTGKYENTAGTTLTSSEATIPFATRKYDSHGAYNGTVFTAPISGVYDFTCSIVTASVLNTSGQAFAGLFRTTSGPESLSASSKLVAVVWGNGGTNSQFLNFTKSFRLNAGDTVEVRAFNSNTIGLALDANLNFFSFRRIGN